MPLPFKPGDTGPEIEAFQRWMQNFVSSYAPTVDGQYDANDVGAVAQMQFRLGLPITGEFGPAEAALTGFAGGISAPAAEPRKRLLGLFYRGTGGTDDDYVYQIANAAQDLIEIVSPPWAATMGGLPVGTAGGIGDPSMNKAAKDTLIASFPIIDKALKEDPERGVFVGGYSAGAFVAAGVRQYVQEKYPDNYAGSFSLGDPTRPYGGCYYPFDGSVDPGGCGVGTWHYGDVKDARHCWLTNNADPNKPDFYGKVPRGKVYEICSGAYNMVTDFSFTDPVAFMGAVIKNVPEIVADAGISVPAGIAALSQGPVGLGTFAVPLLIGGLQGLIGLGNPETLTGTAAAGYSARIALEFYGAGTWPHVSYHLAEVWPGCTYIQLGIQHTRYWASQYLGLPAA